MSGFVLDDLYLAGDTVWYEEVELTIERHRPRVAVVNAGGAEFVEGGLIVMGADDVREVVERVPVVVAVHMEALKPLLPRARTCSRPPSPVSSCRKTARPSGEVLQRGGWGFGGLARRRQDLAGSTSPIASTTHRPACPTVVEGRAVVSEAGVAARNRRPPRASRVRGIRVVDVDVQHPGKPFHRLRRP